MKIKKYLPLSILLVGGVSFFALGGQHVLDFAFLHQQSEFLHAFVTHYYALAVLVYIACYVLLTALSLPIATLATLAGGFMFGAYWGTFYTVIAASIGATLIFMAARYALSDFLARKSAKFLNQLKDGFNANAFSYMLTLRLVPLFPFVVVNIAPALLAVKFKIFVIATFIGIIPGTFVYNLAGASLADIFADNGEFSASAIMTPKVILSLVALGLLSLVPVAYKYWQKK